MTNNLEAPQNRRLSFAPMINFLKRHWRDYTVLFLGAGLIIALDQWTKALVRNNIPEGGSWAPWPWLAPYARIVHWYNTGAAFGILKDWAIVFTILAFIVAGLIIYYYPRVNPEDWTFRLAMCLQLGGAVGNLVSRLTSGLKVTDFISIGNFPVFNVADSSITISVFVLLIGAWAKERAQKKQAEVEPAPEAEKAPASAEEQESGSIPSGEEIKRE